MSEVRVFSFVSCLVVCMDLKFVFVILMTLVLSSFRQSSNKVNQCRWLECTCGDMVYRCMTEKIIRKYGIVFYTNRTVYVRHFNAAASNNLKTCYIV